MKHSDSPAIVAVMLLDAGTAYLMGAGFVAIAGMNLLMLAYRLPGDLCPSARLWGLGSIAAGISWALFALDDLVPEPVIIIFGNFSFLVAAVLIYGSVRLFDGKSPRHWLHLALVLPVITTNTLARFAVDNYEFRAILMSAAVGLALFLAAHQLRFRRPESRPDDLGRRVTSYWLFGNCLILLLRIIALAVAGRDPSSSAMGVSQSLVLAVSLISVTGLVFSYFLLYTGRVTTDLKYQADRDPLTGLYNRRAFELHAAQEIRRAVAAKTPLALLMIDVNEFKRINDDWGHEAGDEALRSISDSLSSNLRAHDVLARLGGDEFVVLLPELDFEQTRQLARRLSESVAHRPFAYPIDLRIGVGVGELDETRPDLSTLLRSADADLYANKRSHRTGVAKGEM